MDLKSMLNVEASAQRPSRLHTPQSSYDARAISNTPRPEQHANRPVSFPTPLQPADSRSQSAGGYFGAQSPHQTSLNPGSPASGPPSAYIAQSPGTQPQPQQYISRDVGGSHQPYNANFTPSPSMSVRQPPTPGSAIHYQNHTPVSAHAQIGPPPSFHHTHSTSQSPRASVPPHGQINPQSRQISPVAQFHQQQPAAPLGPPSTYSRGSPSAQRPISRGYDQHYRQGSYGSVSSVQSREHTFSGQHPPDLSRADSVQRQQSMTEVERVRERDRSISVSPKTIPKPTPYRQSSSTSTPASQGRSFQSPSIDKQISASISGAEVKIEPQTTPTPKASLASVDNSTASRGPSLGPTLIPMSNNQQTPAHTSSPVSIAMKSSPAPHNLSLKRSASHLSDADSATEQSRKRLRRGDIPVYAQNARKKGIHFGNGSRVSNPKQPAPTITQEVPRATSTQAAPTNTPIQHAQPPKGAPKAVTNGHASVQPVPGPGVNLNDHKWEPTIANEAPREDLSFAVANWIFSTIGREEPPSDSALFEIEAKIGEIHDIEEGSRLRLPVSTETVFNRDMWRRTKFESSMNMEQHRLLNQYLNKLTQDAHQNPGRAEVRFEHLREVDEFFELNEEGVKNLNPSIKHWLKPRQAPRVRRTTDKVTGQQKAMIIKSRISDLEIYNPGYEFDYRISISIESPWNGDLKWLTPMKPGDGATRQKDRMSYRHLTNQIDLTQVAHEDTNKMEHELEVEMSTLQLYTELEKLKTTGTSRFEDLVRSLVDNTRLLCREGSLKKR